MIYILRLLIIFIILSLKLNATEITLKVFLNTNNCFSCESSLRNLKYLDKKISLEININEDEKEILVEYLSKFDLQQLKYTLKYHKKIKFDKRFHFNSYFQILINKKIIATFYGETLETYIVSVNSISVNLKKDYAIKLKDSEIFSKASIFSIDSNYININDFNLGKNITYKFNSADSSFNEIKKLQVNDLLYSDFFKLGNIDTNFYSKNRKFVESRGTKATFEQALIKSNVLYLQFSLPTYLWVEEKRLLKVGNKHFFLKSDLINNESKTYYIKDRTVIAEDSTKYFVDNTKSFFVKKNELYLPLFATKYKGAISYKFIKMKEDADTIKFNYFSKYIIAKDKSIKYNLDEDVTFANKTVAYNVGNKVIYDFENNELILDFLGNKEGGLVLDVKINGSFIKFLTLQKNKFSLITFDKITKKRILTQNINFNQEILSSSGRIFNSEYLFFMDKKCENFIFKSY